MCGNKNPQDAEARLSSVDKNKPETATGSKGEGWGRALLAVIIGNLKFSVTNVHIRYEDSDSHPDHPFAAGLTLGKIAAVTVDENGKETFVTSGAVDRVRKVKGFILV